jgi:hypothetical protein
MGGPPLVELEVLEDVPPLDVEPPLVEDDVVPPLEDVAPPLEDVAPVVAPPDEELPSQATPGVPESTHCCHVEMAVASSSPSGGMGEPISWRRARERCAYVSPTGEVASSSPIVVSDIGAWSAVGLPWQSTQCCERIA